MHPITILSFGYLHPWPQDAPDPDITVDLRRLLNDPARALNGAMLDSTGLDREVRRFVFNTPGARRLALNISDMATEMAMVKPVVLAFGCAGGRHRSVALAQYVADVSGYATVQHLHVHLPRVIRTP